MFSLAVQTEWYVGLHLPVTILKGVHLILICVHLAVGNTSTSTLTLCECTPSLVLKKGVNHNIKCNVFFSSANIIMCRFAPTTDNSKRCTPEINQCTPSCWEKFYRYTRILRVYTILGIEKECKPQYIVQCFLFQSSAGSTRPLTPALRPTGTLRVRWWFHVFLTVSD